jgi:hypothetical protein
MTAKLTAGNGDKKLSISVIFVLPQGPAICSREIIRITRSGGIPHMGEFGSLPFLSAKSE